MSPKEADKLNSFRKAAIADIERRADPRALRLPVKKNSRRYKSGFSSSSPGKWRPAPKAALSIVLGTYNRLGSLKLTIDSIRTNGFDDTYEIVVIDGGSTDGTVEWLTQQKDIISVVQHNRDSTRNFVRKRSWGYFINIGFRISEAPWILMVSDDCLLLPNSMKNALDYANFLEAEGRPIGGVSFYFRDWPVKGEERYYVQHTIGGMLMVNHGLFRKDVLEEVGYAEENEFSFYKADSDLCLKIWHAGYEIVDCKSAFVEHLVLPSELLRATNNQSMDDDRNTLFRRWDGIYEKLEFPDLFAKPYREYLAHHDPENIAEQFRPVLAADNQ